MGTASLALRVIGSLVTRMVAQLMSAARRLYTSIRKTITITAIELAILIFMLYADVLNVHESRDIALESEEHQVLLALPASASPGSLMADPSFGGLFRLYENLRWDLRGHEQMRDLWFARLSMHYTLSPGHQGNQSELEVLRLSRDMLLRQVQEGFAKILPSETKRISGVQDNRAASRDLAMLVGVGFYIHRFGSWSDAKVQIRNLVSDEAERGRVLEIFQRIESAGATE